MAYRATGFGNPFGFRITPWVKRLMIANAVVYVVMLIVGLIDRSLLNALEVYLALQPASVLWRPWTLVTYMFVHAGFLHLLFNMLGLFFFGPPLEERWGSREFLKFYLISGLGGAALSFIFPHQAVVGASAAVFGVMLGYAYFWPDNPIYIWGIFPVKAKWMVMGLAAMNLLAAVGGGASDIAYLAHLGGFAAAYAYLKSPWAPPAYGPSFTGARAKKKSNALHALKREFGRATARATTRNKHQENATVREEVLLDEVDRILDKISASGLASLTAEERKRLDEASRRFRTN